MNNELKFIDLLKIIWKKKIQIIVIVFLSGVFSVFYALSLPDVFKASAVLLLPEQSETGVAGLLGQISSIPFIGSSVGAVNGQDTFEILNQRFLARANLKRVTEKFRLREFYGLEGRPWYFVKKAFRDNFEFKLDKQSGIVVLSYWSENKVQAHEIVNYCLKLLDEISRSHVKSENSRKLGFLEKRYSDVQRELFRLEDELQAFMVENRLTSLESQVQATVSAVSKLSTEKLLAEIRLGILKELGSNEQHPKVRELTLEISSLKKKITEVQGSNALNLGDSRPQSTEVLKSDDFASLTYVSLANIPKLRFDLERLERAKVVQLELFKVLAKEYEVLKIEAAKERRFIEILSPSYVPEVKDQPKRAFICIGITLLASFFGFVLVLLWGVYDFSCANSREEEVTN